jgi:hypothetical protein
VLGLILSIRFRKIFVVCEYQLRCQDEAHGNLPAEDLTADLARVGLDAGVEAHMPREHIAARKGALAHVTEV